MRIITGSAKGLKLKTPRGMAVRPTGDRVKESIFNILAGKIANAMVADLFAGTGNLGLEALSRGASSAVFVDNSVGSLALMKENAARAKLTERVEIIKGDVLTVLNKFVQQKRFFHLIFCDPPYNRGFVAAVLQRIDADNVLFPDGVIIVEHSGHEDIPMGLANLEIRRTERYGETIVSFLTLKT